MVNPQPLRGDGKSSARGQSGSASRTKRRATGTDEGVPGSVTSRAIPGVTTRCIRLTSPAFIVWFTGMPALQAKQGGGVVVADGAEPGGAEVQALQGLELGQVRVRDVGEVGA